MVLAHESCPEPWAGDVRCCLRQARPRGPIPLCPRAGFRVRVTSLVGSAELICPCGSPCSREWSRHPPLRGGQPHLAYRFPPAPQARPQARQQERHGVPKRDRAYPVPSSPRTCRTTARHGTASVSPHPLPWKWAGAVLMESRPGTMAPAPSEASPGPPALPRGALGVPCSSLCPGGWWRSDARAQGHAQGGRDVSQRVAVPQGFATSPPTHPLCMPNLGIVVILERYKILSLLWRKAGVTAGTACTTAGPCPMAVLHWPSRRWQGTTKGHCTGSQAAGQEKPHLQGKGSIGRGAEPLTSPSLLPGAIFHPPQMQGDARRCLQERDNWVTQEF